MAFFLPGKYKELVEKSKTGDEPARREFFDELVADLESNSLSKEGLDILLSALRELKGEPKAWPAFGLSMPKHRPPKLPHLRDSPSFISLIYTLRVKKGLKWEEVCDVLAQKYPEDLDEINKGIVKRIYDSNIERRGESFAELIDNVQYNLSLAGAVDRFYSSLNDADNEGK